MNANVAVTEARVEPITCPRDRVISVHLRTSAAKIPCLRRWLGVCGAARGFAGMSELVESLCCVSPCRRVRAIAFHAAEKTGNRYPVMTAPAYGDGAGIEVRRSEPRRAWVRRGRAGGRALTGHGVIPTGYAASRVAVAAREAISA
jgi:hypothetical protein